jgi:hypothetical protein
MKPGVAPKRAWAPQDLRGVADAVVAAPGRWRSVPAVHDAGLTAPVSRPGWTVIIVFVIACAVVADRLVIGVSTGGRGTLSLLTFVAPAVAMAAVVRNGAALTLGFLRSPVFVFAVAPYLVLTFVLPVLGIMFHGYPERTLIAVNAATTAFSFLVLGATLAPTELRPWRPWIALAIVLQLLYALGQVVYLARGPGWELFGPFHDWDLSLQAFYGSFVQARGTGLYFNPNELGLWAGVAAILAWTILAPRLRIIGVTLAVLTLLVSQSRGASVALVAAVAVGAVLGVVRGRASASGATRAALSVCLAVAVAVTVVVAIEPTQGLVDRFGALLAVWAQGPQADANLAGRLDYWASVLDLNVLYPWGTWGPPELLLGSAVDSSWFQVFAQGSMMYVAALVLLLVAPFGVRSTKFGDALVMLAVLIAVAGLTQTPFSYPAAFLYWGLLGASLQSSITDRVTRAADLAARGPARRPINDAYDRSGKRPARVGRPIDPSPILGLNDPSRAPGSGIRDPGAVGDAGERARAEGLDVAGDRQGVDVGEAQDRPGHGRGRGVIGEDDVLSSGEVDHGVQ